MRFNLQLALAAIATGTLMGCSANTQESRYFTSAEQPRPQPAPYAAAERPHQGGLSSPSQQPVWNESRFSAYRSQLGCTDFGCFSNRGSALTTDSPWVFGQGRQNGQQARGRDQNGDYVIDQWGNRSYNSGRVLIGPNVTTGRISVDGSSRARIGAVEIR